MTQPLVIVGTGLAGYICAKEFRKHDQQKPLHLITQDDGAFYSKPLLSTSLTQNKTPDMLAIKSADDMATELNATIHTHAEVKSIDLEKRIVNAGQDDIEFSHLVLATGAKKIRPPLAGDGVDDIQSVNNLMEYRDFRAWLDDKREIIVLGAGLVGCEFANDLANQGVRVTIVAPEQYPLATLVPEMIGKELLRALNEKGVTWQLGHLAIECNKTAKGMSVTLDDGRELHADGVFSAIGLRSNTALAEQMGLAVQRGIVVNRWLQTSEPNVFALGDCAEVAGHVKMYVAPILQCARALGAILAGGEESVQYPAMPVVIKTPACPVVVAPPPSGVEGEWHVEGEAGHQRALYHDREGQLRGFALIGDKVGDRIQLAKQLPGEFSHPAA